MRSKTIIAAVGFAMVSLMILGLVLTLLIAIRDNQLFYGRNVYGLPLSTYSTIAMLIIAGLIGVVSLTQWIRRRNRCRGGR